MINIKEFLFNRLNRVDCHANLYGESALDKYCDIANVISYFCFNC
jgi:hypothetical protein